MEERNLIELGRTPDLDKQADADDMEKEAVAVFGRDASPTPCRGCKNCKCKEKHDR